MLSFSKLCFIILITQIAFLKAANIFKSSHKGQLWTYFKSDSIPDFSKIISLPNCHLGINLNYGIYMSMDRIQWRRVYYKENTYFTGLAFNNKTIVGVGYNNRAQGFIFTSSNGSDWEELDISPLNEIYTIAPLGDYFVTGGFKGEILISDQTGKQWAITAIQVKKITLMAKWGNDVYFPYDSKLMKSSDGINWEDSSSEPGLESINNLESLVLRNSEDYIYLIGTLKSDQSVKVILYKFNNSGYWSSLKVPVDSSDEICDFKINQGVMVTTTSDGNLMISNDEGKNWKIVRNGKGKYKYNNNLLITIENGEFIAYITEY